MSVPIVEYSLLSSDRELFQEQLVNAIVEQGYFYLTGIDKDVDDDVLTLLREQSKEMFNTDQCDGIPMDNTFLGSYKDQSQRSVTFRALEVNKFPSGLPYMVKSIADSFQCFDLVSNMLMDSILESLAIRSSKYSTTRGQQFQEIKLMDTRFTGANDATNLLRLSSIKSPFRVQTTYGEWLEVKQPLSNALFVQVGQTLEFLTEGVCVSTISGPLASDGVDIQFECNYPLDYVLRPWNMREELVKRRDSRKQLRSGVHRHETISMANKRIDQIVISNDILQHRAIGAQFYPDLLKSLEDELQAISNDSHNNFLQYVKDLQKIFASFDNVLHINVAKRFADIPLVDLVRQVHTLSGISVTMSDLLRVCYIWDGFLTLKLDDGNDIVIDVDKTKQQLSLVDLSKRQDEFNKRLGRWCELHPDDQSIPILSKSKLSSTTDVRSAEGFNRKRKRQEPLQRSSIPVTADLKGMSLLDRIRMKESLRNANSIPPEVKYTRYLDSKLGRVLDLIATLRNDRPHAVDELKDKVIATFGIQYAISEQEANDLVMRLPVKFPGTFKLVKGRAKSVIRWKDIDINELKRSL